MLALLSRQVGGPATLSLQEIPSLQPKHDEVVIDMAACGINYPDALIIEDLYQYRPERPFSPGAEVAGVVRSVGSDVTWPKVGMRVMAMGGWGGLAEQVIVKARSCFAIPDSMPFDHAAAFIMTYGTAYHALVQRGAILRGETLVVLGAAGGVGLATVQIGRALGAHVVAGVTGDDRLEIVKNLGAHDGFTYSRTNVNAREIAQTIKGLCGSSGANVILDTVGGSMSEAAVRALGWNGRLLIVGFPAGIPALAANLLLLKGAAAVGVFYGAFTEKEPELDRRNMDALLALYAVGDVKPIISSTYSLSNAAAAIAALSDRDRHGKIVVTC